MKFQKRLVSQSIRSFLQRKKLQNIYGVLPVTDISTIGDSPMTTSSIPDL